MAEVSKTVEAVARAICKADDCDPDQIAVGLGHVMPEGQEYPLWMARVKQAEAALQTVMMLHMAEKAERERRFFAGLSEMRKDPLY